jgi:hypothetical protein
LVPEEGNERTFEISRIVSSYLPGWEKLSIAAAINMLTLSIKTPENVPPNSNLLVVPKGGGKNTFLNAIMQCSNPEFIIKTAERQFEYFISEEADIFDNKVWTIEDLIISFKGLTTKQREQLISFYTSMLSNMSFERMDIRGYKRLIKGRIVCMFGFAAEDFHYERESLWTSTFLERAVPLYAHWDADTINRIRERTIGRHYRNTDPLPEVRLPFRKELIDIRMSEDIKQELQVLVNRLAKKTNMSYSRATNYICNFLKANAYLNGREVVSMNDIELYKYIEEVHFPYISSAKLVILEQLIQPLSLDLLLPRINDKLRRQGREINEYQLRKCLNELYDEGYIEYDTIERGKRIYWRKR